MKEDIAFARSLRKRMTPEEVKLWVRLREWRHSRGYHFSRQASRGETPTRPPSASTLPRLRVGGSISSADQTEPDWCD
ncbi:MAG: DUF559 domain-containing protein [Hyphomicrobiales bacterium]